MLGAKQVLVCWERGKVVREKSAAPSPGEAGSNIDQDFQPALEERIQPSENVTPCQQRI